MSAAQRQEKVVAMAKQRRKKAEESLLQALACGATVEGAAGKAGVSQRTAYRRLADPSFKRRLQELRADMVQRMASALTAAGGEAVRALLELLRSSLPGAVRLGAARSVLEIGLRLREATETDERLTVLEELLIGDGGRGQ
jgi:hypothetical protein